MLIPYLTEKKDYSIKGKKELVLYSNMKYILDDSRLKWKMKHTYYTTK